jgi:hypothetical protein
VATYRIPHLPGQPESWRVLGANSLDEPVYLTRLIRAGDPRAAQLERQIRFPAPHDSPLLAPLVELGIASDGWLTVVEKALPAVPLAEVVARARERDLPFLPEACAWFGKRLCEVVSTLGTTAHLRLTPRNVLVQPDGEPLVLGTAYARLIAPSADEQPFLPRGADNSRAADSYAAAEIVRLLASLGAAAYEDDWGSLPLSLKACFVRAKAAGLSPAALAASIGTTFGKWGKKCDGKAFRANLQRLDLRPAEHLAPASAPLQIEPRFESAEEASWTPSGSMDLEGRIERFASATPVAEPPPPRPPESAEPLELDERALADAFKARDSRLPASRRGLAKAVLKAVALLLALGGIGALLWARAPQILAFVESLVAERPQGAYGTALLRIESTPPGAQVLLGDQLLGETPYLGDNDLPAGAHRVRLIKSGYQPATASFEGGRDVELKINLRRR